MSATPLTIKLGGVAGEHRSSLEVIAADAPPGTVVVHGGGREVADWSRRLGHEPRYHDGRRVTDPATLEVAAAVLGGLINARLVAAFEALGRPAVGLGLADGGTVRLERADPRLGEVGHPVEARAGLLDLLTGAGLLPVVSSIGSDGEGRLLNVNADEAAGAIAAERGGVLLLLSDVPGVMRRGQVLPELGPEAAEAMLAEGSASDGMFPKLTAALRAARAGCMVRILDGRSAEAVAAAIAGRSAGTLVTSPTAQEVAR
ncbi:MAG TPA: acetylglutamate kinase [Candidatus Binatia bacterium]|nr:acetylglutamate kinase [Candidatus Binatia bacterium]